MAQNKIPPMMSAKPMTCPECEAAVSVEDVRIGRCPRCRTKIRIPQQFKTKVRVAMIPTILLIVAYGMIILPSGQHSDAFVLLCYVGTAICGFVWMILVSSLAYWLTPPRIERDVTDVVKLNLS